MHDSIEVTVAKRGFDQVAISEVALDKGCGLGNGGPFAVAQVIEDCDGVTACKQKSYDSSADISCTTSYENVQNLYLAIALQMFGHPG